MRDSPEIKARGTVDRLFAESMMGSVEQILKGDIMIYSKVVPSEQDAGVSIVGIFWPVIKVTT